MQIKPLVALALVFLMCGPAFATGTSNGAYQDGTSLRTKCNSQKLDEYMYCVGYVLGVADTFSSGIVRIDGVDVRLCIPLGTPVAKVLDPVSSYLNDSETNLSIRADQLVTEALVVNFRCDLK
jgi:Rap1a immunity proteins